MKTMFTTQRASALVLVCGLAAAAGLPAPADAGVVQMTFEPLAHNDNVEVNHGSSYDENGFRVQTDSGEFSTFGTAMLFHPGSTALITPSALTVVTLSAVGGSSFDLLSIQIAKRDTGGSIFPVSVTFTGTKADQSTVTATFNGTVSGVLLQDFTFPATFTDLTEVTWVGTQRHQFDNITLIPGPSAAALLGAAGIAAGRRRRR